MFLAEAIEKVMSKDAVKAIAGINEIAGRIDMARFFELVELENNASKRLAELSQSIFEAERQLSEIKDQYVLEVRALAEGPDGQRGGPLSNESKRKDRVEQLLRDDPAAQQLDESLRTLRWEKQETEVTLYALRRERQMLQDAMSLVQTLLQLHTAHVNAQTNTGTHGA
jgi:hypothetical protein